MKDTDVEFISDRKLSRSIEVPKVEKLEHRVADRNARYRIEEEMLRACVSEGMSREQIMDHMEINNSQLTTIEKRLLANDGQRTLSMSTAQRYYQYFLKQEQCVRDLDYFVELTCDAVNKWKDAAEKLGSFDIARKTIGAMPSIQGAVIAVKAKSDIYDRTIKMGQELGIIAKRAKEIRVSGQLNLAALPTEQLKKVLEKKLDQFDKLVSEGKLPENYIKMLKGDVDEGECIR